MNHDKLRTWLKLPDGPWPPDYYTLIGFARGDGTANQIETRIWEQLEHLRKYQLVHPDEATEGMTLLAQALDTLTSTDSRREYDQKLGIKSIIQVEERLNVDDVIKSVYDDMPMLVPLDATDDLPLAQLVEELEQELIAEEEPVEIPPIAEPPPLPKKRTVVVEPIPDAIVLPTLPPLPKRRYPRTEVADRPKKSRLRQLYADAVRLRRVLTICDQAHPYFTNHEHTFSKPDDAVGLIACLGELQPLLSTVDDLIGKPNQPGHLLATMARQRLMIDTFRNLLPGQRERLAKDFRSAHYRLEDEYQAIRREIRARSRRSLWREYGVPVQRFYGKYPEIVMLPVGLFALLVAVLRG